MLVLQRFIRSWKPLLGICFCVAKCKENTKRSTEIERSFSSRFDKHCDIFAYKLVLHSFMLCFLCFYSSRNEATYGRTYANDARATNDETSIQTHDGTSQTGNGSPRQIKWNWTYCSFFLNYAFLLSCGSCIAQIVNNFFFSFTI